MAERSYLSIGQGLDLLKREFTASRPNEKWCGDITYVPVGESGFVYFATVIDLYSRRLAGWSIADHMRTDLVLDALRMALATSDPGADVTLVHHSLRSDGVRSPAAHGDGVAMGRPHRRQRHAHRPERERSGLADEDRRACPG